MLVEYIKTMLQRYGRSRGDWIGGEMESTGTGVLDEAEHAMHITSYIS